MTHALVTGGAGFIGSHLVARLLADGHEVRVLDNLATGSRENLAPWANDVEFYPGDIRSADTVRCALRGITWVFHLAAHVSVPDSVARPEYTFDVNVSGTASIAYAAAAAGVERLLTASSSAVYSELGPDPIPETSPTHPMSPYGASKLMGECLVGELHRSRRLAALSFRFFNVYGPRQRADSPYSGVVALFLDRARRGLPLTVYGDGGQTRDFVAVQDVVDCLVTAAEGTPSEWPDVVNVGTGHAASVAELADLVLACADTPAPIDYAPERRGDLRHSCADVRRAATCLQWRSRTTLADGIRQLWDAGA